MTDTTPTPDQIRSILQKAGDAANFEARKHEDKLPCGFAWITFTGVRGNTALGRALKAAGVSFGNINTSYRREFYLWGTGWFLGQSIDAHEACCKAAIKVLHAHGLTQARMNSRLD